MSRRRALVVAAQLAHTHVPPAQQRAQQEHCSLTDELERFVDDKVESGLYNNASEVVREGLRLLEENDEFRARVRESIERGWAQVQAGDLLDGATAWPTHASG